MTPINGQRLYFLDDTDIWAGEDLESCIIAACNETGMSREQVLREPAELTDAQVNLFMEEINSTLAIMLKKALDARAVRHLATFPV